MLPSQTERRAPGILYTPGGAAESHAVDGSLTLTRFADGPGGVGEGATPIHANRGGGLPVFSSVMTGTPPLIPAFLAQNDPARLGEARVLMAILGIVIVLLAALLLLTVIRRVGRPATDGPRTDGRSRRVPRSPWAEAGKRARPVDAQGNLPDDDEPRDRDDLEETH